MKPLPAASQPLAVRTSSQRDPAWQAIQQLIAAPVRMGESVFFARIQFLDDTEFYGAQPEDLIASAGLQYRHSFLVAVDDVTLEHPELAVLVISLRQERGRVFRALPGQIQAIENNLSLSNMDFFEFADRVDPDGVFRGFRRR